MKTFEEFVQELHPETEQKKRWKAWFYAIDEAKSKDCDDGDEVVTKSKQKIIINPTREEI